MTAPWDEMSKTYPLITDKPSMQRVREILRSEMDDFGTAVDIGCGPGNQSIPLSEMFRRVYSVDLSPGMLARLNHECEERGIRNITTVESDWRDVKLPELCDLAFSSLCLASYEGLMKLEELSKGLCIYIGGTDDAVCTEKDILDELGLECI